LSLTVNANALAVLIEATDYDYLFILTHKKEQFNILSISDIKLLR